MSKVSDPADSSDPNTTYHCGTLTYTKAGIAMLFSWLLWGDFCYTLMESVVPSILPLKLKDLGCSNWLMGAILITAPGVLNMTICPWISFKSDRYRSRWGRRIPFIIGTLPFLCIFLTLLGLSDDTGILLQRNFLLLSRLAPATVTIALIAVFMIIFQFFNMFVGSVFWYLFNDVVPASHLGRFIGAFRIVGTGASALYNYFIFGFAETHMREIFIGAAILYFIGFGLVCFMVKEGAYPPLESKNAGRGLAGVKTFLTESFSHRVYWLVFSITASQATCAAINTFMIFYYKNMGMTIDQVGKMSAIGGVAALAAMYLAAIFIDRWHPLRVQTYLSVFAAVGGMMALPWLLISFPGNYFFWLSLGGSLIAAFFSALSGGCAMPLYMRMFPQSRYGQFCSAQALFRSFCTICAGAAAGMYIDFFQWCFNGSDYAYRFVLLWGVVFNVTIAFFSIWAYRKWYELGGDAHYHPPAKWSEKGIEGMPIVTIVGPQFKWLKWSFCCFHGIMAVSVIGIVPLLGWMYQCQAMTALFWHAVLLLPLSLLAYWGWLILEKRIHRDIVNAQAGKPLINGIPHHGVLLVAAIKFLLALGLWIVQVVICINLKMETAAIIFTAANVLTDFMLIGGVWLMCRIERGYSNQVDVFMAVRDGEHSAPIITQETESQEEGSNKHESLAAI